MAGYTRSCGSLLALLTSVYSQSTLPYRIHKLLTFISSTLLEYTTRHWLGCASDGRIRVMGSVGCYRPSSIKEDPSDEQSFNGLTVFARFIVEPTFSGGQGFESLQGYPGIDVCMIIVMNFLTDKYTFECFCHGRHISFVIEFLNDLVYGQRR